LSIVLIGVGLFIRIRLVESPAFERVKERQAESKLPLLELWRHYRVAAILATGVALISMTGFYIVTTFTLSYVTGRFGIARNVPLVGLMIAGSVEFMGIVIFAWLADRVGKRAVAIWSAGCLVLISYPFFWLVNAGQSVLICLAMSLFMVTGSALYSVTGVLLAELFETRVRYSGISFGYQMAGMI
jgi:MFS transporter, MHS family, shikimate and dehydroshikimate transport protein